MHLCTMRLILQTGPLFLVYSFACAPQAEQRQQKFDQSPGGRAARKAVADVAKERQAGRPDNDQTARDWVN